MATPSIKTHNDDIIDVKRQSLYARLRRLFSTDVIVRNVGGKQLKIKDTDNVMYATDKNSMRDRFNRIRSTSYNAYTRDFALSYQAARMDLFRDYDCVGPDTIIPLPDGTFPTIAELTEKYKDKPQERFYVFSYDHKTDSIKLGKAYHPRKKDGGMRRCWKVIFDNDEFIIGSAGHPFLMRNGEYKKLENLSVGDSIMPFYKKDFFGRGYIHLYNFSKGWQTAHKIIAEQFYRPLLKNEVVHHKNHRPSVNIPTNLQIMTKEEHSLFHSIGKNNPFYGRKHTKESNEKRSKTLKEVFNNRNQSGEKNPKYRDDLSIEVLKLKAIEYYKSNGKLTSWEFIKDLKCDYSVLQNRLQLSNTDWNTFKNEIVSTLNHKIKAIEYVGEMEVYDVTVEEYQNFATSNCFVHNTMDSDPILASALDIYADECVGGETLIPLLSGEKIKIEDLYLQNRNNFWVYSMDQNGNVIPEKCERVALNGKKQMYKLTLDDGTEIKCTSNHQWVKNDGSIITTSELTPGTSLKVAKTKLSSNKFMNGYEMLLDNGKWKYTHRIIANYIPELIESRDKLPYKNRVIHHSSFNKRNNDPSQLTWMDWKEHKVLHAQHNKDIWSDPTKSIEYKEKIRSAHKQYWTDELKTKVAERQRLFMNNFISNLTNDEIVKLYARRGNKNGMFNNGYKLEKEKNGRWKSDVNRPDKVDINNYELDLVNGISVNELKEKYNLLREDCKDLNRLICKKYGVKRQDQIKYKIKGYNSCRDYQRSNNHRVVSIELDGEYNAYDLVNVGNSTHLYAVECKDGSKLFTHNCLTYNEMGNILTVHSTNNNVKEILENLFNDILNIQHNLWSWTRNMCKYGDFFLKLYITPEYGIYMVDPISAYNVERIENTDPYNKRYVKFQIRPTDTAQAEVCENYEMAHFRLMSDSNFLPYGKSVVEGARRVWKQLSLMEDAMLIHRIMRAPEKRIFYTDVGNLSPDEVELHMKKQKDLMKKVPYMDEMTGDYNLRFNLMNMVEDYFIAVRGGDSGTKIDTLGGMDWTGTEDIEYLRNKMMAALKIPKAFLGYEESVGGKATLASEDVRFARTIQRVQRILTSELTKIAIVHLYSQGYRDESLVEFELELTNPSTIFEREKLEIWNDKVDVAVNMMEAKLFSKDWIYKNIFNMSEDDAKAIKDEVVDDVKQNYRFASIEEEGNDPAQPFKKIGNGKVKGGGGGGGGGGMGGGLGGGLGGMGGPEEDPEGGPEEDPEGGSEEDPEGGSEEENPEEPPVVKEVKLERDQSGEHKASDHPFGEDPLGSLELMSKSKDNSEGKKKSEIRHNFEGGSPLSMKEQKSKPRVDKTLMNSLSRFNSATSNDIKQELLAETHMGGSKKSLLDETNILE